MSMDVFIPYAELPLDGKWQNVELKREQETVMEIHDNKTTEVL